MKREKIIQRLLAMILLVSMMIAGTAGAYADSVFGPLIKPSVDQATVVPSGTCHLMDGTQRCQGLGLIDMPMQEMTR